MGKDVSKLSMSTANMMKAMQEWMDKHHTDEVVVSDVSYVSPHFVVSFHSPDGDE